jgi:hypothetical protein
MEAGNEANQQAVAQAGRAMLPTDLIVPSLQRIEEVLEDLEALDWEVGQIALHPELPVHLVPEAEEKIAQARGVLQEMLPLVQAILAPFADEQAALKAVQEAVLRAFCEQRAQGYQPCPHQEVGGQHTAHLGGVRAGLNGPLSDGQPE